MYSLGHWWMGSQRRWGFFRPSRKQFPSHITPIRISVCIYISAPPPSVPLISNLTRLSSARHRSQNQLGAETKGPFASDPQTNQNGLDAFKSGTSTPAYREEDGKSRLNFPFSFPFLFAIPSDSIEAAGTG